MGSPTPTQGAPTISPPPTDSSVESYFTDSAINMDLTMPTVSPQSKPQLESDQFESETATSSDRPMDTVSERLGHLLGVAASHQGRGLSDEIRERVHNHLDRIETALSFKSGISCSDPSTTTDGDDNSDFEPGPELVSHLTATVSSLRLRHQEQVHLQSLFTSKLESLAQRSLEHEATICSLKVELESLHTSNGKLERDNAQLVQENHHLRDATKNLKGEVVERETALEAMTGAVRGLEGWIESASTSPRSGAQIHRRRTVGQESGRRREVVRGKGRFRGRYHIDAEEFGHFDGDHDQGGAAEADATELQEGVMAWVRGFKDVEEGIKSKTELDVRTRPAQTNGRPPREHVNHPTDTHDEEFGDFETGG